MTMSIVQMMTAILIAILLLAQSAEPATAAADQIFNNSTDDGKSMKSGASMGDRWTAAARKGPR